MAVYTFNPLHDPRWTEFVKQHPRSSIFHTAGWLEALQRTYGYEPIVYTTSAPGTTLKSAVVFCRIKSWLTGRRLVSLPFADHCEPLVEDPNERGEIFGSLQSGLDKEHLKYVEIRPRDTDGSVDDTMEKSQSFCFHALDLEPALTDLFRSFQKESTQRKVRRAEREGLRYEAGRSQALVKEFYRLSLLTRQRHKLPPQPIEWFHNLIGCLGDAVRIHVAFKDERAVASILTLHSGTTLVYKYGASDAKFHSLGGMPFLFWKAIQEGKEQGDRELDLGRSDSDNEGLITFKSRLGATRSELTYKRFSARSHEASAESYAMKVTKQLVGRLPASLLTTAGRLLYKHVG
jgi:CelD/BcsL family acetyltransferase involved in cellulose biosynthesis